MEQRGGQEKDRQYQEALQAYLGWCAIQGCEAFASEEALTNADPFAHARLIAADQEQYGRVQPGTRKYIEWQNTTRTLESIQRPFRTVTTLDFDGQDLRQQTGQPMLPSMHRSIVAANALRQANPEMDFFAKRTIYEFAAKQAEIDMMQSAPDGTVIGLFSPCEQANPRAARELGMFPGRDMGVVQLSRKRDAQTLDIVNFSFDQFSRVLKQMAADHGIELPADCQPEDVLGYRFAFHTETLVELHDYIDTMIERADAELLQPTRQGQPYFAGQDTAREFWENCGPVRQEQLRFDDALAMAAGQSVCALHPLLRHDAQTALHATLGDVRSLLNDREQTAVRKLLAAEKVHISNAEHHLALHTLKKVHETGIDEIVRRHMQGDKKALLLLPNPHRDRQPRGRTENDYPFMSATITAVEEGRFASGCGNESRFGQSMGSSGGGPSGFRHASEIIKGWMLPDLAYLQQKYGVNQLRYSACRSCDVADWCGPCHCCATCDRKDTAVPGYIAKRLALKQPV